MSQLVKPFATMYGAAPPTPSHLEPGSIVAEKYRVERVLGHGGMGIVVKGLHLVLDEPVAIKFLLPELAQHAEATARFMREAKAALRIKSEHVTRVLDVGVLASGDAYMVMEFLEGQDLSVSLQGSGPMPVSEAVDAIIQACRALADAHHIGIIHRDLKPANLFLTRDGSGAAMVKVLDFGISKVSGEGIDALTKTTTTMGSALYMSPEQMLSSRDVDPRTDIYALGVTLYELLSGRLPFMEDTMPQLVAAILEGQPYPLAHLRQDLPPGLADIVHTACARDPSHRHRSAAELAAALAPFASPQGQALAARFAGATQAAISGAYPASSADRSGGYSLVGQGVAPIAVSSHMAVANTAVAHTAPPATVNAPPLLTLAATAHGAAAGASTQAAMSRTLSSNARRSPALAIVAALVLVAVTGGAAWLSMRASDPPAAAAPEPVVALPGETAVAPPESSATEPSVSADAAHDVDAGAPAAPPVNVPPRVVPPPKSKDMYRGRQ